MSGWCDALGGDLGRRVHIDFERLLIEVCRVGVVGLSVTERI